MKQGNCFFTVYNYYLIVLAMKVQVLTQSDSITFVTVFLCLHWKPLPISKIPAPTTIYYDMIPWVYLDTILYNVVLIDFVIDLV